MNRYTIDELEGKSTPLPVIKQEVIKPFTAAAGVRTGALTNPTGEPAGAGAGVGRPPFR